MKAAATTVTATRESAAPKQTALTGESETHPSDTQATPPGRGKEKHPRVAWYASLLIILMLLSGAGWELWRWLLLVIALD